MFRELFINACILITILFIGSQVFQERGISRNEAMKTRVILGILGGISSCILILFSINITSNSVLDFRLIIQILVAMFGGFLPSIITGLLTAVFRLWYQGFSYVALFFSVGILLDGLVCGIISLSNLKKNLKIAIMYICSIILYSFIYLITLEDKLYACSIILRLFISSAIVGVGVNYLVNYLVMTHKMLIRLKNESTRDFLTGLDNTRKFDLVYNETLRYAVENNNRVSLLIIDIDHFKNVNDTYGHIAGDGVLKELGLRLSNSCRNSDIVSRIGGEEFSVLIRDLSREGTLEIAERIRTAVEKSPFTIQDGKKIKITVSVGVAIYPDTTEDTKILKETADNKLYQAKRTGRNKVCI